MMTKERLSEIRNYADTVDSGFYRHLLGQLLAEVDYWKNAVRNGSTYLNGDRMYHECLQCDAMCDEMEELNHGPDCAWRLAQH